MNMNDNVDYTKYGTPDPALELHYGIYSPDELLDYDEPEPEQGIVTVHRPGDTDR